MSNYKDTIIDIQKIIVDLTSMDALLAVPAFQSIYQEPTPYISDALDFLSSPNVTDTQKMIAGLSMQNIGPSDFLSYASNVFSFLEDGKISPMVFSIAVFPPRPWNKFWRANRTRPEVRDLLGRIANSPRVRAGTKAFIKEDLLEER